MNQIDLVCPAGGLPALRAAVDNGANGVYIGFRDGTNARNFAGLNFSIDDMREGIGYAHERGAKVLVALNTYPSPTQWPQSTRAVDTAAQLGVDAVIIGDAGLLAYAAERQPGLRRHLSVQSSATNHEAVNFYVRQFGVQRVVLPRVLSLAQVQHIIQHVEAEVEVFGFGSLCVMVEGRCALSSYVTGESPNTCGVCSPAKAVRWEESAAGRKSRLNGVLIDVYAPDEPAGYPTLCKGRFTVQGKTFYAMEEPTCLNTIEVLPDLLKSGVRALKVEGRQRSPTYVAQVTRVLRAALDACYADPQNYRPREEWIAALDRVAEGHQHTLGALERAWQ